MEFEEIDMCPFTTPTTCYSGARNGECNTIQLATETNLFGIDVDFQNGIKRVSSETFRSNFICVGHSQWDDDNYASVYLNPSRLPAESDEPTLSRPLDRDDADASVVSNSVPTGNASVVSTKSLVTEPSSKTLNPEPKSKEQEPSASEESEKMDGRLVLTTPEAEFHAILTGFRPLSPCLACWGEMSIGVWLGSADDSQLRLYMPNGTSGTLDIVMTLPRAILSFKTPVLAIDFASVNSLEILAVACQDGTIQLMTWRGDGFEELGHYQVIVDGPILSVRVQNFLDTVNVFVGSLCGYVCLLSRKENDPPNKWDGPKMVVEGLQNRSVESADSVVVVDVHDNIVAVGTHAGRCLLYARIKSRYFRVWECQLPYSVHGILFQKDDDERLVLLVTTRRSLHLFLKTKGTDFSKQADLMSENCPSAANIQNHLLELLKPKEPPPKVPAEVEESDADAPSEPIEDAKESADKSKESNTDHQAKESNDVENGDPKHETNESKDRVIEASTLEPEARERETQETKNEDQETSPKEPDSVEEQIEIVKAEVDVPST